MRRRQVASSTHQAKAVITWGTSYSSRSTSLPAVARVPTPHPFPVVCCNDNEAAAASFPSPHPRPWLIQDPEMTDGPADMGGLIWNKNQTNVVNIRERCTTLHPTPPRHTHHALRFQRHNSPLYQDSPSKTDAMKYRWKMEVCCGHDIPQFSHLRTCSVLFFSLLFWFVLICSVLFRSVLGMQCWREQT